MVHPPPKLLRLSGALLILLNLGCVRRVQYASPDGRRVDVLNVGFDTQIGHLRATTQHGSFEMGAYDSDAVVAAKLVEVLEVAARLAEGGRP